MESLAEIMTCQHCQALNSSDQKFCTQCSFPIGGSEHEQRMFQSNISNHKFTIALADKKIKGAKTIILILAGLFFIIGLYMWFGRDNFADMLVNVSLSLIFLILAAWTTANPFGAILTAFILYLTVQVISAFISPETVASGFIWKIIIIGSFVKGIRSAQEAQTAVKELEKVKAIS